MLRSPLARPVLLSILVLALASSAAVANDDKVRAAEHFALAESAEQRKDWQTAISEYTRAYELSPHPAVLYNIALNHERLGQLREAAHTFLRYLDGNNDAEDRDKVLARVKGLRERPSKLEVLSANEEVQVFIDGEQRGVAPIKVELPGGPHRVFGQSTGGTSPEQVVLLEYGAPATVMLDVATQPGNLSVYTNVRGAEVVVDGALLGYTPFHGQVPSGTHTVELKAIGYQPVSRSIEIPPLGSEQVRENLELVAGYQPADPPPGPEPGRKVWFGASYGYQQGSGRYVLGLGLRVPSNRWDVAMGVGYYGLNAGAGLSADFRYYLATKKLRPYLRTTGILGGVGETSRSLGLEGAAGILFATMESDLIGFGYEYFVEIGVQLTSRSGLSQEEASDRSFWAIPFLGGIQMRFGR